MEKEKTICCLIEKAKKENSLEVLLEYVKKMAKEESNEISIPEIKNKTKIKK